MKVLYRSPFALKTYVALCDCCKSVIEATRQEVNDWVACPVCHSECYTSFSPEGHDDYVKIMEYAETQTANDEKDMEDE